MGNEWVAVFVTYDSIEAEMIKDLFTHSTIFTGSYLPDIPFRASRISFRRDSLLSIVRW